MKGKNKSPAISKPWNGMVLFTNDFSRIIVLFHAVPHDIFNKTSLVIFCRDRSRSEGSHEIVH